MVPIIKHEEKPYLFLHSRETPPTKYTTTNWGSYVVGVGTLP